MQLTKAEKPGAIVLTVGFITFFIHLGVFWYLEQIGTLKWNNYASIFIAFHLIGAFIGAILISAIYNDYLKEMYPPILYVLMGIGSSAITVVIIAALVAWLVEKLVSSGISLLLLLFTKKM